MKKITLRTKITATIAGLLALTGIVYAVTPTQFTIQFDPNSGGPIGVAASSNTVYVSEFSTQNIDAITDDTGRVSLFATIPNGQGGAEKYLAISPGLGTWAAGDLYVTQGSDIYKVPPDASGFNPLATPAPTPFVTIQGCGSDGTGITFDQVGTFGYDMIVTCQSGTVWRVNPAGTPSSVANMNTALEGPAVVPSSFGPLGGQLWVADEIHSQVRAIKNNNDGTYTVNSSPVVSWDGAEGVFFIPDNPCTFGDLQAVLFAAVEDQNAIYEFSQNDISQAAANGKVLVTSETGNGIGVITTDGTNYSAAPFDGSSGVSYEGAVVGCEAPPPTPTPTPTVAASGTPTPTPTASPTPCNPLAPCTPPYPFPSNNSLTNLPFNESEVLRTFTVSVTNACLPDQAGSIQLFYNDEHALTLGVRQVIVKTSTQTTTTNYPISAAALNPGSVTNPQVGSTTQTGDQAGTDVSGRPMFPALFVTDVTNNPNSLAGDWQYGGTGIPPTAVFGTWKGAVRTVDYTRSPTAVTITPDADPVKNNWNLGSGSDPVPAGLTNQGWGAEARWDISKLGLQGGHTYRLYFMAHDGDQNKAGGDSGQGCAYVTMPSSTGGATATPSPTPTPTPTPIAPPSASLAVSASTTSGNSLTTASFTMKANTTYLVFAFTNSATGDSATSSSTFSGSPALMPIGTGSLNYNNNDYEFGWWVNGGATDSAGKLTITFVKNTKQAYIHVIQLGGNNLSNPIAQSAYGSGNNTNPYTANLPSPTSSGDSEVDFLSANEDLKPNVPVATPAMTNLVYKNSGPGTAGTYTSQTATQNTSFAGANHHWGTIAVEINHN